MDILQGTAVFKRVVDASSFSKAVDRQRPRDEGAASPAAYARSISP
ncbi:hypothetical protein [Paraburkholderia domus]|nr:hypothetical protein [Paraburkholderia domus]MBK5181939.1 hypothetical protein [Burkholderia sp. R-69749]CAE6836957.1 hypothetical protein R69749_04274 [Paraburkholderia domus]